MTYEISTSLLKKQPFSIFEVVRNNIWMQHKATYSSSPFPILSNGIYVAQCLFTKTYVHNSTNIRITYALEKERYLTRFHDKCPYTYRKILVSTVLLQEIRKKTQQINQLVDTSGFIWFTYFSANIAKNFKRLPPFFYIKMQHDTWNNMLHEKRDPCYDGLINERSNEAWRKLRSQQIF